MTCVFSFSEIGSLFGPSFVCLAGWSAKYNAASKDNVPNMDAGALMQT
jgi:hypothetical protein